MRATYRVRVDGDGRLERNIEADNVAVMGPFIVFQQEKPLRGANVTAVVYVVSADNLIDIEEVGATPDPQEIPDATPVVRAALETDGEVG